MPDSNLTAPAKHASVEPFQQSAGFAGGPAGTPGVPRSPLERPIAAMRRYKWLMVAIVSLSTLAGVGGLRFIPPQYEVHAIVWLQSETPQEQGRTGPIRSSNLLASSAWVELLKSYRVVDAVVRQLALYLTPENAFDAPLFQRFALQERSAPGKYEIDLDGDQQQWILKLQTGAELDRGSIRDSVGRKVGFVWTLPSNAIPKSGLSKIRFTVVTPREKSVELIRRLNTRLALGSNFLWMNYEDPSPALASQVVNAWANEFVTVAAALKKANMVEFSKILDGQLQFAQTALADAEASLENFRVNTITLPTEGGPVAAGVELTRDPALRSYFDQKIAYDNLKQDREALERTTASAIAGRVPFEALLQIPSVALSAGAEALRAAFAQRNKLRTDLAVARSQFTDEVSTVRMLVDQLTVAETQTIPTLTAQLLTQLQEREGDYQRRIAGASREIRSIPPRTMEEMRRQRTVTVSAQLYTTLKSRYAEAKLAEASATPDIRVLDPAVAPLAPTKNTAPTIMLLSVAGGIGLAIGLAILLDLLDGKFRYPEQATDELGLPIAGTVPRLPKRGIDSRSPEQVTQLVESFRSLRMHVMHEVPTPATLAVTSAAPGDGKSLVSVNLAVSFAEAGLRTLLVDGDTRRGNLHETFDAAVQPGLTEYLVTNVEIRSLVQRTSYENLSIIACGRRHVRSPELLGTPKLTALVQALRQSYDVVIFDTPPLAAGIDGYAISAATGNLLMIVRIGQTERRLAAAKLAVADHLPINMIGTVLNCVDLRGEFQYYGYAVGYSVDVAAGELMASNPS